jgi:hypothetical protein
MYLRDGPGRLKEIVQAGAGKGKGLPPKRQLVRKQHFKSTWISGLRCYEPIKNSGLLEKLLYFGRNRSVSY